MTSIEERITRTRARLRLISEALHAQNESDAVDLERVVEGIEQVVEDCLSDLNSIDFAAKDGAR